MKENRALFFEKKNRQNVQDLKLWPRESLSFRSMGYSSREAKKGGELDGASLF